MHIPRYLKQVFDCPIVLRTLPSLSEITNSGTPFHLRLPSDLSFAMVSNDTHSSSNLTPPYAAANLNGPPLAVNGKYIIFNEVSACFCSAILEDI